MRLSTKGEYASRAMLELALRHGAGPQHIRDISAAQDIPERFLEQILLQLKRAGYLRSRKGPHGGYRLSRPPESISVAEVIRVMDGPLAPIDCVSVTAHEVCPKEDTCVLKGLWKETRDAIASILERTTLADLVARSPAPGRTAEPPARGPRKPRKAVLAALALAVSVSVFAPALPAGPALKGKISISGAWALYPMALKWAAEFRKLEPGVVIDVQAGGAGKGIVDTLAGMVDIGMVSRDIQPVEIDKGALALAVAKDGVVPTASAANPHLAALLKKGLTRAQLVDLWIREKPLTWGQVLGTAERALVRVFTRSDACGAAETWAAFLGGRQEDLAGIGVYGDPGLADAARRDPLALGYNNINFAYDSRTLRPLAGLAVVPLDLDGDRTIGPDENFYATRNDITAAIAANRYPSPPARELYFVTKGRPAAPAVAAFLRWVLDAGQAFVPETGYIRLGPEALKAGRDKLAGR